MSKTFLIIFLILAVALAVYNIMHLDFNHLFEGESLVACIGILASLCAILLLLIFWTSKRIQGEIRKK